jgi:hypothetical protein
MKVDRRRLLQTTAAVVAAASLPTLSKQAGALTLVDATLTESELHAAGMSARTSAEAVQPDLVRQWRDGLGARIASAETAVAYVRWDKALVLVGLARESRMGYRAGQIGRSVFAVRLFQRAS